MDGGFFITLQTVRRQLGAMPNELYLVRLIHPGLGSRQSNPARAGRGRGHQKTLGAPLSRRLRQRRLVARPEAPSKSAAIPRQAAFVNARLAVEVFAVRSRQMPSSRFFVVHPGGVNPKLIAEKLAPLASVEQLPQSAGLLVSPKSASDDPREAWRELRAKLGEDAAVTPLLLDEDGEPAIPTGEIVVRFSSPPADEELRCFAVAHRLELRGRNAWVPSQVSFAAASPAGLYLPDLVEDLQAEPNVRAAWAKTLAHYRRAS